MGSVQAEGWPTHHPNEGLSGRSCRRDKARVTWRSFAPLILRYLRVRGQREQVLLPFRGCKHIGTTLRVAFRATLGLDGDPIMDAALYSPERAFTPGLRRRVPRSLRWGTPSTPACAARPHSSNGLEDVPQMFGFAVDCPKLVRRAFSGRGDGGSDPVCGGGLRGPLRMLSGEPSARRGRKARRQGEGPTRAPARAPTLAGTRCRDGRARFRHARRSSRRILPPR
jgi:hypothetical protein